MCRFGGGVVTDVRTCQVTQVRRYFEKTGAGIDTIVHNVSNTIGIYAELGDSR